MAEDQEVSAFCDDTEFRDNESDDDIVISGVLCSIRVALFCMTVGVMSTAVSRIPKFVGVVGVVVY